jgi:zinc protease
MRYQSASDIGAALIGAELHGFGVEYLQNFPLVVGKVDVETAKRAAAEILDPKNYVIVMVGDAKDLEPQLEKAGWRYEKVSYTEPVTKELKQPEVAATPADPKTLAASRQIVAEALAAKGGKKLASLKSLRMAAKGTTKIQGQQLPVEIERVLVLPDKMRIDASIAQQFKVIVGVDGKSGWQQQPDQTGKPQTMEFKTKEQIEQAQFEVWRDADLILLQASDKNAKLSPAPDETINGKPHAIVRVTSPYGPTVAIAIDKKSKLVSRISFEDSGMSQTEEFDDYKDVSGIKVAHKRQSSGQGRVTQLEITKVEWDPKIEPTYFQKPK